MKTKLLTTLSAALLLLIPNAIFGQSINLGTTSGFAIFTKAGAITNTGGATSITGDVGSFSVTPTGFTAGTVTGTIYNFGDPLLTTAAADVTTAYSDLSATTTGFVLTTPLENQVLVAGVYSSVGAITLNGDVTLDGQGNANSIFIIKINGAFAVGLNSNIILTNSASLSNVYWQVGGQFDLGAGSVFRGTVVGDGAINLFDGSSVLGRVLTVAGAITVSNSVVTIPQNTVTNTESPYIQNSVKVASNPANSSINIQIANLDKMNNYTFKLYNGLGIELTTTSITENQSTISTSNFSSGIYFYKVLNNNKVIQSGKLIFQQ